MRNKGNKQGGKGKSSCLFQGAFQKLVVKAFWTDPRKFRQAIAKTAGVRRDPVEEERKRPLSFHPLKKSHLP